MPDQLAWRRGVRAWICSFDLPASRYSRGQPTQQCREGQMQPMLATAISWDGGCFSAARCQPSHPHFQLVCTDMLQSILVLTHSYVCWAVQLGCRLPPALSRQVGTTSAPFAPAAAISHACITCQRGGVKKGCGPASSCGGAWGGEGCSSRKFTRTRCSMKLCCAAERMLIHCCRRSVWWVKAAVHTPGRRGPACLGRACDAMWRAAPLPAGSLAYI